jgi:predicted RNA binding protein YcfA (HicA-like mRNA interferase family)
LYETGNPFGAKPFDKGLAGKPGYVWKKVMSGKEVVAMLERNGWVVDHISGSHHIMEKNGHHVSVPVHGSAELKLGLYASIKKQVNKTEGL